MTNTEKVTTEHSATEGKTLQALRKKEKKTAHLWKKGTSGNPNKPTGRPVGSKNKHTLLKEAILMDAEDFVLRKFKNIVETTCRLAEAGDSTCLKILWDRVLPKDIDKQSKSDDKMNITINIDGLKVKQVNDIDADVVEAEILEHIDSGNVAEER